MKNKKTLLLIIVGIILVLLIISMIVFNTLKTKDSNDLNETPIDTEKVDNTEDENYINNIEEIEANIVDDPSYVSGGLNEEDTKKVYALDLCNLYFNALNGIELFNSRLGNIYDQEHNINQDEDIPDINYYSAAYNCLDPIYLKNSNVSEENINQFAGHYVFLPTSGFRSLQINQIIILFGNRINKDTKTIEDYGYIVQINESDNVFSIIPYDFMKNAGLTSLSEGNKISLNDNVKVEARDSNYYSPSPFDAKKIASEYTRMFKQAANYHTELAYSKLTNENKTKYGSAENFKKYLDNNSDKLNSMILTTATEKNDGDYNIYTCYDTNGNTYYIKINSKDAFDYSIELSNIVL